MAKKTGNDLLHAAQQGDYHAIQQCLTDGVPADYVLRDGYGTCNALTLLLQNVGKHRNCSDTQTMECIKLLYEHGVNLNYSDTRFGSSDREIVSWTYFPVDRSSSSIPINQKDVYNAVKFVLTHGGQTCGTHPRDVLLKRILEERGIMTQAEFRRFEEIGVAYMNAKEQGIVLDVDDIQAVTRFEKEYKIKKRKAWLQNGPDQTWRASQRWNDAIIAEMPHSLQGIAVMRAFVAHLTRMIDHRETEIMKEIGILDQELGVQNTEKESSDCDPILGASSGQKQSVAKRSVMGALRNGGASYRS